MNILIRPVVTEKATALSETLNSYTFVVSNTCNKIQIKNEVESTYKVSVVKVRTLISPATRSKKRTKNGIVVSKQKRYKKAIVSLKEGDSIDFYDNINS